MTRRSCLPYDGEQQRASGPNVQRRPAPTAWPASGPHSTASALLALQATAGNRAVTGLLETHRTSGAQPAVQRFVPGAEAARRANQVATAKEIDSHNAKLRKTTVHNGAGGRQKQRLKFEKGLQAIEKKIPTPPPPGAMKDIYDYVSGGAGSTVLGQVASDPGTAGLDWYNAAFAKAATTEIAREFAATDASTVFRGTSSASLLIETAAKENTALVAEWCAPIAQWASTYKSAYSLAEGDATARQVKYSNIAHHYRQLVDRIGATPRASFSPSFIAACKALFTEANASGGMADAIQHVGNAITLRMVAPYITTQLVGPAPQGSGEKVILTTISKLIQKQSASNKGFNEDLLKPFTPVLEEKAVKFTGVVLALGMT